MEKETIKSKLFAAVDQLAGLTQQILDLENCGVVLLKVEITHTKGNSAMTKLSVRTGELPGKPNVDAILKEILRKKLD